MTDSESSAVEGSKTTLVSVTSSLTADLGTNCCKESKYKLVKFVENYSISEQL